MKAEFNGHPFSSLAPPVWRASTVRFDTLDDFLSRSRRLPDGFSYGTTGTPTHRHLEARLAAMDGARHALVLPSGQAAIVMVMLQVLSAGDHFLISASSYGPAIGFATRHLRRLGVDVQIYDPRIGGEIVREFRPRTRLVWMESPGSLTMEVQDVEAIATAAAKAGILTAIDNTWAGPLYSQPLALGVTLSVQAGTKYLGGHSDLLMGVVTTNDSALYADLRDLQAHAGQAAGADDCFLVERGLDTFVLRMQVQSAQALTLAERLEGHPAVARVLHPALPSSEDHGLWRRQFRGSGSVFSVVPRAGSLPAARAFFDGLGTFAIGASWGSVHSLAAYYPAAMQAERPYCAVHGPLIRLSVGLEPPEQLLEDVLRALARMDKLA